uniref:Uncharacterized protein n=1 Tax=Meleagris gallopavo TaxID=9103 RepID=A0A803XMG8_MELGA
MSYVYALSLASLQWDILGDARLSLHQSVLTWEWRSWTRSLASISSCSANLRARSLCSTIALSSSSSDWRRLFLRSTMAMFSFRSSLARTIALQCLDLLLGLSCCTVGMAQLDLHLIEVTLHLLLQPQVHHPQVVAFGLLHLLILLSKLAFIVSLHLIKL